LPSRTVSFQTGMPQDLVWERLSDPKTLGSAVPMVEEVIVAESSSRWLIRQPMATTTLTPELEAHVTLSHRPTRVTWEGVGQYLTIKVDATLSEGGEGGTVIELELTIQPGGFLASLQSKLIAAQIETRARQLAEALKQSIESQMQNTN